MKRSKRFLALLLSVLLVLTTVASTSLVSVFAETIDNSALCSEYYATNPDNQVGKQGTITIDGSFTDWSQDMLIAKGGAWDVANHYKGGHENCVLDTTALFASWDSQNLYIGWQMVNTTDTWAREGDGPLSDGGRVLDVPLILALRVDPSKTAMSNKNNQGGSIWGQKMGLTFDTPVDHLLYMSGKPGNGEPAIFTAVDAEGNTDYTTGCKLFKAAGIEYKMAEGNIMDSIMGLNYSESPADVTDSAADWVDYKTFKGQSGTHNTKYDSFYEIKIPFSVLGIDANYITNNGIGAMLVATRGESALDCIPFDTTMLDNATGDYASDSSTSHEKDDEDVITVDLARIGKMGEGGPVNPPVTQPATAAPTTVAPTTAAPTQAATTAAPTQAATTVPATTAEPTEVPTTAEPTEVPTTAEPIITLPKPTATEAVTTATPTIPVPTLDFDDPSETTPTTAFATKPSAPVIVPDKGILGDTDGNEKVNIKDATLIQKHLAKVETLSELAQELGNVDGNEVLNIRDVTFIQKWLAKMDVDFAIGEPVAGEEIIVPVPTAATTAEVTTAPVVIPVTTTAPATTAEPTVAPTTAEPTVAPTTVEPTVAPTTAEPTVAPTTAEPVYTEPQYTEPVYTDPVYTEPDYPDYPDDPVGGTITIYFENTNGWGNVCWHAWNDAGATSTPWPGDAMTNVSGNIYSATISAEYTGIIFNDGTMEGAKTDNAIVGGDGQMYSNGSWVPYDPNYNGGGGNDDPYNPPIGGGSTVYFSNVNNWDTVYVYCWNDGGGKNAEWPGVTMTLVEEDNGFGQQVYAYDVPADCNWVIFSNGNGHQCADINLDNEANRGFYLTGEVVNDKGHYGYESYAR